MRDLLVAWLHKVFCRDVCIENKRLRVENLHLYATIEDLTAKLEEKTPLRDREVRPRG